MIFDSKLRAFFYFEVMSGRSFDFCAVSIQFCCFCVRIVVYVTVLYSRINSVSVEVWKCGEYHNVEFGM